MKTILSVLLFSFIIATPGLWANDTQLLVLSNGKEIKGYASGLEEGRLLFKDQRSPSSISYSFAVDEVHHLRFSEATRRLQIQSHIAQQQYQSAYDLLSPLYQQQSPYFAFMAKQDIQYFQNYVEAAYHTKHFYTAAGVAAKVLDYLNSKVYQQQLRELELLAHLNLPLKPKIFELATQWLDHNPSHGDSALGWYVLSILAYSNQEFEKALSLALEPISQSTFLPMKYLGHCYAIATKAAENLQYHKECQILLSEMSQRKINWPQKLIL